MYQLAYVWRISFICILIVDSAVLMCPTDETSWTEKSSVYKCITPSLYHCGITSNGTVEEFCFPKHGLKRKYCPMFHINTIVTEPWNCTYNMPRKSSICRDELLPNVSYVSNTLYKYPVCFLGQRIQKVFPSNEQGSDKYTVATEIDAGENDRFKDIVVSFVVLITMLTVNILVLMYIRRNKKSQYRDRNNIEQMSNIAEVDEAEENDIDDYEEVADGEEDRYSEENGTSDRSVDEKE